MAALTLADIDGAEVDLRERITQAVLQQPVDAAALVEATKALECLATIRGWIDAETDLAPQTF